MEKNITLFLKSQKFSDKHTPSHPPILSHVYTLLTASLLKTVCLYLFFLRLILTILEYAIPYFWRNMKMKHGYFIHNCFQLISYICLAAFLLIVKYSSFKKNHVVSFTTFCSTRSQNIELQFVILLTDTTAKKPFSLSKDSLECQSFSLVVPLLHLHCKMK